jgi:hypothetical protein
MLSHNVFFTLKDASDAAADHLVAACRKYLKDHPGVLLPVPARPGIPAARQ